MLSVKKWQLLNLLLKEQSLIFFLPAASDFLKIFWHASFFFFFLQSSVANLCAGFQVDAVQKSYYNKFTVLKKSEEEIRYGHIIKSDCSPLPAFHPALCLLSSYPALNLI